MPVYTSTVSRMPAAFAPLRPAGRPLRPAGQTIAPSNCRAGTNLADFPGAIGCDATGWPPLDADGFAVERTAASSGGITNADVALYNSVAGSLNTTGAAIANAIATNDQGQIERLRIASQQAIDTLRLQAATAQANGNLQLALQQNQQANALQTFNQQAASRVNPNTLLYVVGGIAALGIIGAIVYMATQRRS